MMMRLLSKPKQKIWPIHLQPQIQYSFDEIVFIFLNNLLSSFLSVSLGCSVSSTCVDVRFFSFILSNQISPRLCCHVNLNCPGSLEMLMCSLCFNFKLMFLSHRNGRLNISGNQLMMVNSLISISCSLQIHLSFVNVRFKLSVPEKSCCHWLSSTSSFCSCLLCDSAREWKITLLGIKKENNTRKTGEQYTINQLYKHSCTAEPPWHHLYCTQ